jgi:hypothetical protein
MTWKIEEDADLLEKCIPSGLEYYHVTVPIRQLRNVIGMVRALTRLTDARRELRARGWKLRLGNLNIRIWWE